jgi:hypothetical protein
MDFAEGAGEAVLDEIICSNDIARKDARVACHTRNESFNFSVKLLIDLSLSWPTGLRFRGTTASALLRI